jgi:hypothetical protein
VLRLATRTVAAIVLAASAAEAQTTTADGIDAFFQGDYQRAADILNPLADRSPWRADSTAELFMALMYENGLGVPRDPLRACALYLRSSDSGPLEMLKMSLFRSFQRLASKESSEECARLVIFSFNPRFQPQTFSLEPGYWVEVDIEGATITYGGKATRIPLGFGTGGAVVLSMEHTELMVGRTNLMRRHFIESFTWVPGPERKWTLYWGVQEVTREDLVTVAGEELATVSGERPPDVSLADIRQMVRLRVNADGDAEWEVTSGLNPRAEVIESEAERKEVAEQVRRRASAEAKVDWKSERDVARPPSLTYVDAEGCGHLFLYGWSADFAEAITVRADRNLLQLSTTPRTFDLAVQRTDLEVIVRLFEHPKRQPFCTDVIIRDGRPEAAWTAVGGIVTIELSPPGVRARQPYLYRAAIRIVGAEFVGPTGARVRQTQPITLTAVVGSGPS